MAKNLTRLEMGLPAGFNISQLNTKKIIITALRSLFGERCDALIDRQLELMNFINEFLYPLEERREYEKIVHVFTNNPTNYTSNIYNYGGSIEIKIKGQEFNLGSTYEYNGSSCAFSSAIMKASTIEDLELNSWKFFFSPKLGDYEKIEVGEILPVNIQKCLLQLHEDSLQLSRLLSGAEGKLKRVLAQYKSVIKLCNESPKFIPWVIEADTLNQYMKKCTDVDKFDDLKELEDIFNA